jgi:predicted nucleotidyltransferase component of viral defense system
MIDRRELLDMATQMSLQPHVVEKDYVLGWMLAGINAHPAIREQWVFKGGTCLKKCFFETYRFSEDLDFTLTDEAQIEDGFLRETFGEIGDWIYERTGIEIPPDLIEFDIYTNPRGTISCQGKVSYRGPLRAGGGGNRGLPRIKLDLTADERLVLAPVSVPVFHPYSDAPAEGITITAYAYEEVFGEKVRALAERTRPRDLYDVINLFRNGDALPAPAVLLDVITQKCAFKKRGLPILAELEPHRAELEQLWSDMLAHQLPSLPPYQQYWDELPAFFEWLVGGRQIEAPRAYALGAGETVLRDRVLRLNARAEVQAMIEVIRFAAANRLAVDLDYDGRTRRIEPYSLRRTREDAVILHAVRTDDGQHRSYRIDRMQGARATNQSFVPRYEVELTPQGPVRIAPTTARVVESRAPAALPRTSGRSGIKAAPRRPAAPKKPRAYGQLTYVYQCPMCQKKFSRTRMDSKLNPHKNDWGQACSGRTGYLVDTR